MSHMNVLRFNNSKICNFKAELQVTKLNIKQSIVIVCVRVMYMCMHICPLWDRLTVSCRMRFSLFWKFLRATPWTRIKKFAKLEKRKQKYGFNTGFNMIKQLTGFEYNYLRKGESTNLYITHRLVHQSSWSYISIS